MKKEDREWIEEMLKDYEEIAKEHNIPEGTIIKAEGLLLQELILKRIDSQNMGGLVKVLMGVLHGGVQQ